MGNSLVVQWLGLGSFTAQGPGSAGSFTAVPCGQKKYVYIYMNVIPVGRRVWKYKRAPISKLFWQNGVLPSVVIAKTY